MDTDTDKAKDKDKDMGAYDKYPGIFMDTAAASEVEDSFRREAWLAPPQPQCAFNYAV